VPWPNSIQQRLESFRWREAADCGGSDRPLVGRRPEKATCSRVQLWRLAHARRRARQVGTITGQVSAVQKPRQDQIALQLGGRVCHPNPVIRLLGGAISASQPGAFALRATALSLHGAQPDQTKWEVESAHHAAKASPPSRPPQHDTKRLPGQGGSWRTIGL
jgi:hypothetical protein